MRVSFSRKPGFARFAWPLVVSAVLPISSVSAQIARLELHAIQTQTPTEQEFLTGKKDAPSQSAPDPSNNKLISPQSVSSPITWKNVEVSGLTRVASML